jgi:choline kinase
VSAQPRGAESSSAASGDGARTSADRATVSARPNGGRRMNAVILAAGRGGRLSDVTGDLPKCLARIGPVTLLERQIATLRASGVVDITVVAGHRIDDVRNACGPGVRLVENRDYATTDSLYSLWLVRDTLAPSFVVLNADVLFHPQLLHDLLTARYEDALLMCSRGSLRYSREEMKLRVRAGRVVEISKELDARDADGENVGIAKFGAIGARVLVDEIERIVSENRQAWLPVAFGAFSLRRPLRVVDTRGFPWIEIDFPEDYRRACAQILPSVEAAAP